MAIISEGKAHYHTKVVDFRFSNLDEVWDYIKKDIKGKISEITGIKSLIKIINIVEFIGWTPNLEKKTLTKLFGDKVKIKDQLKGSKAISLDKITRPEYGEKTYFKNVKKEILNNIPKEFVERRGLDHDGAIAAFVGYQLYVNSTNTKSKFNVNISTSTILKELKEYSHDDVEKMVFLHFNNSIFLKRIKHINEFNEEVYKIRNELSVSSKVASFLLTFDRSITINDAIISVEKEIAKLQKTLKQKKDILKNRIDMIK